MGKGSLRAHRQGKRTNRTMTASAPKRRHDAMKKHRNRADRVTVRASLNTGDWA